MRRLFYFLNDESRLRVQSFNCFLAKIHGAVRTVATGVGGCTFSTQSAHGSWKSQHVEITSAEQLYFLMCGWMHVFVICNTTLAAFRTNCVYILMHPPIISTFANSLHLQRPPAQNSHPVRLESGHAAVSAAQGVSTFDLFAPRAGSPVGGKQSIG